MYSNSTGPVGSVNNQDSRLFGFSYKENDLEELEKISPVPPNMDDGVTVAAGGMYGYGGGFNLGADSQVQQDYDAIRRFRCIALHPEIDAAVEDIVN